jgi:hypothetical protein
MKVPQLAAVTLGLFLWETAGMAQISTNCTPTKNQVVLRQRIAEIDAAEGRLDATALRGEVNALHRQGKIDDQQLAEFNAIIQKSEEPKGPADTPEGRAAAQAALEAKLAELREADRAVPVPANPEAQAKALAVLETKMEELRQAESTALEPAPAAEVVAARQAVAQAALAAKLAEMDSGADTPATVDPEVRARADAALAAKVAELDQPRPVAAPGGDPQVVAQQALAAKMAELNQSEAARPPTVAPAPGIAVAPAPAPVAAPAPAPAPAPAVVVAPTPAPAVSAPQVATTVQPVPASPADQLRAQEALRAVQATPAPAPSSTPASTKTGLERLEELTQLYRANKITPQEYHTERAKIVNWSGQ